MNLIEVIRQLTPERMMIDAALRALAEVSDGSSGLPKRRGRPAGNKNHRSRLAQSVSSKKKKSTMLLAARQLVSEAQKKRWADQKRAAKRGKGGATKSQGQTVYS
jgi:hypothetical protein